jgi:hypothetical protein
MAPNTRPPDNGVDPIARTAARKQRFGGTPDRVVFDEAAFDPELEKVFTSTEIHAQVRQAQDTLKRVQGKMMNNQADLARKQSFARRGGLTRRQFKSLVARFRRKTIPTHPFGVMATHVDRSGRQKITA